MQEVENLWEGRPLEYWIRMLSDPDDHTRWQAIDAIRDLADPSASIIHFIAAISDPYWRARALAIHAIEDLLHDARIPSLLLAVRPLADALTDADSRVSQGAAFALELFGPAATAALPRLRVAAESNDSELRLAAAEAIAKIAG